jgi:hypothetical protein
MASAPAGAQGVRDAVDILLQKHKLQADEDVEVVVITGDGAAYGMGLSATSAAMDLRQYRPAILGRHPACRHYFDQQGIAGLPGIQEGFVFDLGGA